MKIATITFNHAHNHGSMLQAYALQQFVCNICKEAEIPVEYTLIDYDTDLQRELYNIFKSGFSIKSMIKNAIAALHYNAIKHRHTKFEDFIHSKCNLSKRYSTLEQLECDTPLADVYISGSDQLWNVRSQDFSDVYYLPFVKSGRRISYAASFGPLEIDWKKYDAAKYTSLLSYYNFISVREEGSADNVEMLTGKRPEVHLDPTFMLTADEWRKIQSQANYKEGKYILLYCLEPTKKQLQMASAISKKLNLPIVVLRYNNTNDWFNPFVHRYDAGPTDFLSYIDHAALVLSSSFHGTAFSLIYHKPFYVFNGITDNRINSILHGVGLQERSIESIADINKVSLEQVDGQQIEAFLKKERQKSAQYIKDAISL
ncbi:polysaccharide pyruvyl transferase family protein [Prevotella sp.]|uniref:polysaccharide pyruvyl transferase family protein n=1 Tax=Prevotella sp. TaxID=59823 RepID=UPI00307AA7A0